MQASSHLELAYQLLRLFPGIQPVERAAFLFGSVEPDLNALTYLKGIAHGMGLHGHNYAQVLPRIVRLSALLKDRQAWRVQDYYRMGKLVHYVADAFTLPHNTAFQGNLRAHIRYEMRLVSTPRCHMRSACSAHRCSMWIFQAFCAGGTIYMNKRCRAWKTIRFVFWKPRWLQSWPLCHRLRTVLFPSLCRSWEAPCDDMVRLACSGFYPDPPAQRHAGYTDGLDYYARQWRRDMAGDCCSACSPEENTPRRHLPAGCHCSDSGML